MFELLEYFESLGKGRDGPVPYGGGILGELQSALAPAGVEIRDVVLDPSAYRRFMDSARYDTREQYYGSFLTEKKLEHFAAATLLKLGPQDVYIDVGAANSPAAEIYASLFGCSTYTQDLTYEPGLNDSRIGGDAGRMPVPDGFASAIALHCAFEHFEGDSDIGFIREVGRVLRPGGRCCVLPLYVFSEYAIQTDPEVARREAVRFETGAVVFKAAGWAQRHGRFYSPARLNLRLLDGCSDLIARVIHFVNEKEFGTECYLKFALLLEKRAPFCTR